MASKPLWLVAIGGSNTVWSRWSLPVSSRHLNGEVVIPVNMQIDSNANIFNNWWSDARISAMDLWAQSKDSTRPWYWKMISYMPRNFSDLCRCRMKCVNQYNQWYNTMIQSGITEELLHDVSDWAAPLIVFAKKESGALLICGDPKVALNQPKFCGAIPFAKGWRPICADGRW